MICACTRAGPREQADQIKNFVDQSMSAVEGGEAPDMANLLGSLMGQMPGPMAGTHSGLPEMPLLQLPAPAPKIEEVDVPDDEDK